jgi:hypothetical protein
MRWLGLLLLLLIAPVPASALIGLGVRSDQIFIQEYWHNGKPHFAIANIGKKDVTITTDAPDGPWKAKAGRLLHVEVTPGKPQKLLSISSPSGRFGLIHSPVEPPVDVKQPYVVHYGLNGSGGRFGAFYSQQKWTFPSGGVIELDLHIVPNQGKVTFPKTAVHKLVLPQVCVSEAKCAGLTITDDGKQIVIDSTKPLNGDKMHVVHLKIDAPKVEARSMVVLNGWHEISGGAGGTITRGIIVSP